LAIDRSIIWTSEMAFFNTTGGSYASRESPQS